SSQCGDLPGGRERLAGATPLHARDGAKSVSPRFAIPARTRIARFLSGFARPLAAAWRGRWRRWGGGGGGVVRAEGAGAVEGGGGVVERAGGGVGPAEAVVGPAAVDVVVV